MFTVWEQQKEKEMWCQIALQLKIQVPLFRQVPQLSPKTTASNSPPLLLSIKQKLRFLFVWFLAFFFLFREPRNICNNTLP